MEWLLILIAGAFETGWAVGLKYSRGVFKACSVRSDRRGNGRQLWLLDDCAQIAAGRHRLCGLDRDRSCWHGSLGHVFL